MKNIVVSPQAVRVTFPLVTGKNVPEFVSQAFVGKSFPLIEKVPTFSSTKRGISYDYKIDKLEAIKVLQIEAPQAARWILDNPQVFSGPYLFFREEACTPPEIFCPQIFHKSQIRMTQQSHVLYGQKILH